MSKVKPKKKGSEKVVEANLLPVMNIMFLLIPALLMAMEFASMASITVSPPQHAARSEDPTTPPEREMEVRVTVASDGIRVSATSADVGAGLADAREAKPSTVARTGEGDADYDFAALTTLAEELKASSPETSKVIVSAEGDVHLQTLIYTMDALRGPSCSMAKGDPEGCLLWRPVIRAS